MDQNADTAVINDENEKQKEADANLEDKLKKIVEQAVAEISGNKSEIARLKSRASFHGWIDRFYGRAFALFIGLIAVCFLYGTVTKILKTDVTSYFFETTTIEVPAEDGKQQNSDSATNATKATDSKAEESKAIPTKKTTTTHVELAWLYALKLFGAITVLYALLWAILALVRSDYRD